jgi:hypothetical protein
MVYDCTISNVGLGTGWTYVVSVPVPCKFVMGFLIKYLDCIDYLHTLEMEVEVQ